MPWPCELIDLDPNSSKLPKKPGTMWYKRDDEWYQIGDLEPYPLYCVLPGGRLFQVNGRSTNKTFWTVTGTPPAITVSPSINAIGTYHGWIQNGVLTDDCEGRTYPDEESTQA